MNPKKGSGFAQIRPVPYVGLSRRSLLASGTAAALALGLPPLAYAVPAALDKSIDVLDRPAPTARNAAAAPMLRVARCGQGLVSVGERGVVLVSYDNGHRWQQARVPVSVTLTGVQFTSEKRGFAIGHSGVVLRTDDAGLTWQRMLDGRQIPALLSQPEAARQASLDGPDKPWLALHFIDDQSGLVVGAFGMALETSDGGQTWHSLSDRIPNPRSLHLYAVHRNGGRVWIAGEQGFYGVSSDGGRSFSMLPTPYRGSFFAISQLDDGQILLGGLRGTLLRHGRDQQFHTVAPASTRGVAQLIALPSQAIALLDQSGRIFTANVANLNFKPISAQPTRTWLAITQATDGTFVGASFDGVSRLQLTALAPKT